MNYLFILLAALLSANYVPDEGYGVRYGNLTDKSTGKRLTGAEIILRNDKNTFAAITDEYGDFKINYLPGKYTLTVNYMGRPDTSYQVELGANDKVIFLEIFPKYVNQGVNEVRSAGFSKRGHHTEAVTLEGFEDPLNPMIATASVSEDVTPETGGFAAEYGSVKEGASLSVSIGSDKGIGEGYSLSPSPSISPKAVSQVSAGKLTSGEVNDFRKWEQWQDIASDVLISNRQEWDYNPAGRIVAQLETESGYPAVGADVRLLDERGNEIWRAMSDNTGKAELWSTTRDSAKASFGEPAKIVASFNGDTRELESPKKFSNGVNFIKFDAGCPELKRADILFAVDATGSMSDEIEYLKAELKDIIGKVTDKHKDLELNLGSVFYRDFKDEYLVKKFDFTRNIDSVQKFIDAQGADGGGDVPEAVENALQTALDNMAWSENAMGRILFLILDAPPHNTEINRYKMDVLARKAALMGVRIVPVACSGIDKSTEYLMRSLALATNGTYIFLTNHSGIGGDHIAPTTDKYDVEFLNGLFVRIIDQFITAPSCVEKAPIAGLDVNDNVFNKNENRVEPKAAPALKCYPNPTDGELTIDCSEDIDELYLADLAGKLVMSFGSVPKGARKIFLGEFPTGVYFLKYSVKGAWAVEKTFLQK